MDPIQLTLVFHEANNPKILELYNSLCDEDGNLLRTQFEQEIYQRLEDSFDLPEQVTTLQAQVEAYQEYIYELQGRLKLLESIQSGVDQILQEFRDLHNSDKPGLNNDAPKLHAKPSLAIRTLKRLHDQKEEE